jgi:hypothetical protein
VRREVQSRSNRLPVHQGWGMRRRGGGGGR